MKYQAYGHIHEIRPEEEKGKNGFLVREFVVVTEGKFPQYVKFQFTGDKCKELDRFNVGEPVEVNFNLKGRAWTPEGRETVYFNTLSCWKLESTEHPGDRDERLMRDAYSDKNKAEYDHSGLSVDDADIPF